MYTILEKIKDNSVKSLEYLGLSFLDISNYKIQELISSSNNPVFCYQAIYSNEKIAVKEMKASNGSSEKQIIRCMQRIQKIQNNPHPYIIGFKGFCQVKRSLLNGEDIIYLLGMDYCECNLENLVSDKKSKGQFFTSREVCDFLCQMTLALKHLQVNLQIAHRDIKPENILLSKNGSFQLSDFDNSKRRGNKEKEKKISVGTINWQAPEIIKSFQNFQEKMSYNAYRADVYSLGLCLLYICTFQKFTLQQRIEYLTRKQDFTVLLKELRKQVKTRYGKPISKIIKLMLIKDNFQRCDFAQLYSKLIETGIGKDTYQQSKSYLMDNEYGGRSTPADTLQKLNQTQSFSQHNSKSYTHNASNMYQESYNTNPFTVTGESDNTISTVREGRDTMKVSYVMEIKSDEYYQINRNEKESEAESALQPATYVGIVQEDNLKEYKDKIKQQQKTYLVIIILLIIVVIILLILFFILQSQSANSAEQVTLLQYTSSSSKLSSLI